MTLPRRGNQANDPCTVWHQFPDRKPRFKLQLHQPISFTASAVLALAVATTAARSDGSMSWLPIDEPPSALSADCTQKLDLAKRIEACSALIARGSESRRQLVERYNSRGLGYAGIGDFENAERDYKSAQRLLRRHVASAFNLGRLHQKQGDCQAALSWFQRAIANKPNSCRAAWGAGTCLIHLGMPSDAQPYLERVVELEFESDPACSSLAANAKLKIDKLAEVSALKGPNFDLLESRDGSNNKAWSDKDAESARQQSKSASRHDEQAPPPARRSCDPQQPTPGSDLPDEHAILDSSTRTPTVPPSMPFDWIGNPSDWLKWIAQGVFGELGRWIISLLLAAIGIKLWKRCYG